MRDIIEIWYLLWTQARLIMPFWAAGLALGTCLAIYGNKAIEHTPLRRFRWLPPLAQIVLASALGALSPVTLHGAIPVIAALGRLGVSHHVLLGFVTTSVIINPNVFIFSLALGTHVAVLRLLLAILGGVGAALLSRAFLREGGVFRFEGFAPEPESQSSGTQWVLIQFLSILKRGVARTGPYLLAGMLIAALFDMYFPRHLFDLVFRQNQALGVLFSAGLSVPVYYCGGGTIPLVRAWMEAGMSPGAAMSFMLVGPVTRMTNLSAVRAVACTRNSLIYLTYSVLYGVLAGVLVNVLLN